MNDLPLSDVRVIDVTVARAGPTCVRQLADWGADVIRIEPPGDVDGGPDRRLTSDFQNLHRNKRSIVVDLKEPEGIEVLMRLVDGADVLVENMRPSVKGRLGFDFGTVHAQNPRLVYASISGFGQHGPYVDRGGVDQIIQGLGGLMSVTGLPGTEPTRAGIPIGDLSAGIFGALGIMIALHDRDRTGMGRWVQVSLIEAMIAMMDLQAVRWTIDGDVPAQEGNHHPTQVPMGCFRTKDGFLNLAGPYGRMMWRMCETIGLPDLPNDPRFDTAEKRSQNREQLNQLITDRLVTKTSAQWEALLNAQGVPCGSVLTMDQVFADPQVLHLGIATDVHSDRLGARTLIRNPVTIDGEPAPLRSASPAEGEHTDAILTELGFGSERIDDLRTRRVVR
jgi:crotonobetainyl-CoA:carnitine CoA-transferase CaiB-like acyl-CoA transferase